MDPRLWAAVTSPNSAMAHLIRYREEGRTTMPQFRKKPVVIEAVRQSGAFVTHTMEGTLEGQPGDWLITGVQGEQYPCSDAVFRKTYEPADEQAAAYEGWTNE